MCRCQYIYRSALLFLLLLLLLLLLIMMDETGSTIDVASSPGTSYCPVVHAVHRGSHKELYTIITDLPPRLSLHYINQTDDNGYTALIWACLLGHFDDTALLLEHGAITNVTSLSGLTALHAAAEKGYIDIVTLLLDCGADVNSQPETGLQETPLMVAAANGHTEVK